jgi:hypothetical protein
MNMYSSQNLDLSLVVLGMPPDLFENCLPPCSFGDFVVPAKLARYGGQRQGCSVHQKDKGDKQYLSRLFLGLTDLERNNRTTLNSVCSLA